MRSRHHHGDTRRVILMNRDEEDDERLLEQAFERLPAEDQAIIRGQLARGGLTLLEWFAQRLAERWPAGRRPH